MLINILHDIQTRITILKFLISMAGAVSYDRIQKILISCLILLSYSCVSLPFNYQLLSSTILPSLCFQSPHSCGSSSKLHTQFSCGQIHFPLLSSIASSQPQLPAPYTPSQPSQFFNLFFPNSQPLIDLPIGTVASHHFPFPLFLCLFCWSIRVGEEEQEMKTGDSLSPCQVAMWRHGAVRCRWWGLKSAEHMKSWEH